jgi:hypothetical protein
MFFSLFFSLISFVILIPLWFKVLSLLSDYLKSLKAAQSALLKINQELELRVEQRTEELKVILLFYNRTRHRNCD